MQFPRTQKRLRDDDDQCCLRQTLHYRERGLPRFDLFSTEPLFSRAPTTAPHEILTRELSHSDELFEKKSCFTKNKHLNEKEACTQ